jgi:hypothetical protein
VVNTLNGQLEKSNNNLTEAINKKSGSETTPKVQLLESLRDRGLKSLFKTIGGACFRLNEEVAAAANKLFEVIKRHGITMYDFPQDQQTSAMASLFKTFEQPDMVAAINLTGTNEELAEVKQANMDYLAELSKRNNETAMKEESKLVGKYVKEVRVNLEKLMNYLDAYLAATENPTLKTLDAELIDIIDKANAVIKARGTRKSNGEKENGSETETIKETK